MQRNLPIYELHRSPHLFEPEGDQVQHGGELTEHNGLGRGVGLQHLVHLLPQSLNLGAALEV